MHRSDPTRLAQCFYVSRSLAGPGDVGRILEAAREQNSRHGVTGALLFTGGHFAQVLEGPAAAVAGTMRVIVADRRHEAVRRLIDGELAVRRFEAWSMAYAEAPGADDLIEQLLTPPDVSQARAERLLRLMFETAGA